MIELNFGPSEYSIYSSHLEPDMITKIPENGELEEIADYWLKDFLEPEKTSAILSRMKLQKSERTFVTVEFPLKCDWRSCDIEKKVIMPWIDERREWVVLFYNKWVESMPKNDERYEGPFETNEYCQKKICEAYRILERDIGLEDVSRTSPEELTKYKEK